MRFATHGFESVVPPASRFVNEATVSCRVLAAWKPVPV